MKHKVSRKEALRRYLSREINKRSDLACVGEGLVKQKGREMKKVTLIGLAMCALPSCTWVASTPSGIREWYRGQNGLVTTGKARPNEADEYHTTQKMYEQQRTLRLTVQPRGDQ